MSDKKKRKKNNRTIKELFKIYGFGFALSVVIMLVAYQFVAPAPPNQLIIATASKEGAYYGYAQQYKSYFAAEKIVLKVIETSGSVENLQLLADKKVEVAFMQGGIGKAEDHPDLTGLASLYLEPLFIFVGGDTKITTLPELAGKRVAIGPEGSGTRRVVEQLLADNKLLEGEKVTTLPIGGQEAAEKLLQGELDAFFMVTRPGAPLVEKLFNDPRASLVNLRRAESYTRLHRYLSHIVMPQGVLDMEKNIPEENIHFIAPAATLVANDSLHPALADLLLQIAGKVHKDGSVLSDKQSFPSSENLDFPVSSEAERYFKHGPPFLQRYLPFWAASLIDRIKFMLLPLVALLLPLMKILPPTYRWRIRSRIYRWYDELHELDLITREDGSQEAIGEALQTLNSMEHDVRKVEVPLSYAEELYNLRLHIDLLRQQLTKLLAEDYKQ